MSDTDLELLARYAQHRTEDAFAEIVRRHLGLVYSAALRQVRSPQLAEEVAQSVFTTLARDAGRLRSDTILSAWLYQVAHHTAANVVRGEARRQLREQIATEMNAMNATTADWTHIEPLLDDAMQALDETDRTAVLLRYFENKSLRAVGDALGTSENAAQKRLARAVEHLREFFGKRGVIVGASGLVVVVSANAVHAAPVDLAMTISTAAAVHGSTLGTSATATITNSIIMTLAKKAIIAVTVLLVCGAVTVVVNSRMKARTSASSAAVVNLDDYVGRFEMPGHRIDIQRKDAGISVFIDGQPAFVAYPQSKEKFVSRDHGSLTEMTFVRDDAGRMAQFSLVRDGRKLGDLKRPANF